jgi:hypothetical protein
MGGVRPGAPLTRRGPAVCVSACIPGCSRAGRIGPVASGRSHRAGPGHRPPPPAVHSHFPLSYSTLAPRHYRPADARLHTASASAASAPSTPTPGARPPPPRPRAAALAVALRRGPSSSTEAALR